MALEHIESYPWFLNKPLDLVANDRLVHTRIMASEWMEHWRPLLGRLWDMFTGKLPKRFLIAVAGPPGVGKSIFAEQLHWIIHRGFFHKEAHSVALPMDGFHFPNAFLEKHTRKLQDGTEIPLAWVKGQPDTIDVRTMRRYMDALVQRPEMMAWPGYSRFTHDPVPDKHHVGSVHNIIIIEGIYLLVDRGPFAGIPEMFDLKIYVDAPAPRIITKLVERHIAGGKELEQAKEWVKRIDLPNARVAEATKKNADVVIERDGNEDFTSVVWKGETEEVHPEVKPGTPGLSGVWPTALVEEGHEGPAAGGASGENAGGVNSGSGTAPQT